LQIVPPVDYGTGAAMGAQPTNAPVPTNAQINDALQDAISDINRAAGFHVLQFTVPVNPITAGTVGPFALYLGDLTPNSYGTTLVAPTALINDVRRLLWTPTGGHPIILTPANRNALDRVPTDYFSNYAATPNSWYVEGYTLFVTPGQATTGTYIITCGTGVLGLQCETDVIDELPIDYQEIIEYQAIVRLSKLSTMDAEAAERAQNFLPDAQEGIRQIKAWVEGLSGVPQPSLGFQTYRNGYLRRKTRR
jgi:hypothetical protein